MGVEFFDMIKKNGRDILVVKEDNLYKFEDVTDFLNDASNS